MSTQESPATSSAPPLSKLRSLVNVDSKLLRFVLLGAVGCLVGAVVGELLLMALRGSQPNSPGQAVCLLIDASSSMLIRGPMDEPGQGNKLEEVKRAASQFVQRQNLKRDQVAVVRFSGGAEMIAPLSQNAEILLTAIDGLHANGSTAIHSGLFTAASTLKPSDAPDKTSAPRSILLFTDGQPDNAEATLAAALACREQKIRIVAIGTGDADRDYLAQLTGDPKLVFSARSGGFAESFKEAEKAIRAGSLVETSGSDAGFLRTYLQTIGWTALLAIGVSLALVGGQNRYLHRSVFNTREALLAIGGGLAAGAAGGLAGQLLFTVAGASIGSAEDPTFFGSILTFIGRVLGWAILGALLGRGLAFFVPNLAPMRALIGGAAGGAAGAVGFLAASMLGDMAGRFLGAAILGAFIGLMMALVEAAFREAWLEVRMGQKEVVNVTLGATPVRIGSDSRTCTLYARDVRPLAVAYRLEQGKIELIDYATESSTVISAGDQRTIGNLVVTVRTSTSAGASPAAAAPPANLVPPPPTKGRTTSPPPAAPKPAPAKPAAAPAPVVAAPARPIVAPPPPSKPPAPTSPPAKAPSPAPSPPVAQPGAKTSVIRPVPPPPKKS